MNKMNPKRAEEESEPRVPTDLGKALAATPTAKVQWNDLTPIARRDFITWIDSAKQPETRRRRIERACSMLAAGKRRPCCYSIVESQGRCIFKKSQRVAGRNGEIEKDQS